MKGLKYSLLMLILLGSSNLIFSQIKLGGTLGFGAATQSDVGNLCNNTDVIASYSAEIQIMMPVNDWFAVKTGAGYILKGRTCNSTLNNVEVEQTTKFGYLTVPVKAQFMAPVNTNKIYVAAGPYAGFLLNANKEMNDVETDIKDNTNSTDMGIAMEIGMLFPMDKNDLSISLNYDMGLKEVVDYDKDARNKALTLKVGLFF